MSSNDSTTPQRPQFLPNGPNNYRPMGPREGMLPLSRPRSGPSQVDISIPPKYTNRQMEFPDARYATPRLLEGAENVAARLPTQHLPPPMMQARQYLPHFQPPRNMQAYGGQGQLGMYYPTHAQQYIVPYVPQQHVAQSFHSSITQQSPLHQPNVQYVHRGATYYPQRPDNYITQPTNAPAAALENIEDDVSEGSDTAVPERAQAAHPIPADSQPVHSLSAAATPFDPSVSYAEAQSKHLQTADCLAIPLSGHRRLRNGQLSQRSQLPDDVTFGRTGEAVFLDIQSHPQAQAAWTGAIFPGVAGMQESETVEMWGTSGAGKATINAPGMMVASTPQQQLTPLEYEEQLKVKHDGAYVALDVANFVLSPDRGYD